jgi:sugar phosphate isomerase/epimerase
MYLTGFADEAGDGIDEQIRATLKLGWKNIEARNIDGKNIHDLSDAEFDVVYGKLQESGVTVNCFGSAIANWGKSIEQPFDSSLAEARRAIPRMKRLGTKLVRIMSFAVLADRGPDDQMAEERFKRLRELHAMFTVEGLLPVHENCMNYGGMGWRHTLRLVEEVPGLKLVFDTGNPILSKDYSTDPPGDRQSSLEFYSHVKEHVAYVHVKDARFDASTGESTFTYPGEGDGDVRAILADLVAGGYDGGISIEPHLAVVFHDDSVKSGDEIRFRNYVEYGGRIMDMMAGMA